MQLLYYLFEVFLRLNLIRPSKIAISWFEGNNIFLYLQAERRLESCYRVN